MTYLKVVLQGFLVAVGLFSMAVLGANTFDREADRRACAAQFIEHDEWNWDCR